MEEIRKKVEAVVQQIFGVKIDVEMTEVPEDKTGDFATNVALKLKRVLGLQNPREIAEKITEELKKDRDFPFEIEIAGSGFLNFIARDEYWKQILADYTTDFEKNISRDEYSGKTVVCEFSDPNPFKVLHVGHLYTSIMGDAISKLIEFAGGKVVRANFGGDVGLHVAKTLYMALPLTFGDVSQFSPELLAEAYVLGTGAYEEDEKAKVTIKQLNEYIYRIAEKGEDVTWDDPDMEMLSQAYWAGRKISYEYFEEFYDRVGVKFDKYYPESTVAPRGLEEVKSHIGEVYEESNGAIIFPGEKYDLHTRVFVNAEGLPTYEAKDVGLIFTKWDDYKFDQSIVITGNDIIDYMKVVLKSVSLYAPELVERTKHITHGNVRLPGNEKMSSRKGNFIKAVDVLDEVTELVRSGTGKDGKGKQSNEDSGADKDRDEISEMIALGAIKYAFLKYKIGGNIEFDAKESVSTTGNSGVYLQYSAVRAKKILASVGENVAKGNGGNEVIDAQTASGQAADIQAASGQWLLSENEKRIIRKLGQYQYILATAVKDLTPHTLANYLFEVAQEFSRFYENVKVAGSEYEAERAGIVQAYLNVMTSGLGLLGIEIPEEM